MFVIELSVILFVKVSYIEIWSLTLWTGRVFRLTSIAMYDLFRNHQKCPCLVRQLNSLRRTYDLRKWCSRRWHWSKRSCAKIWEHEEAEISKVLIGSWTRTSVWIRFYTGLVVPRHTTTLPKILYCKDLAPFRNFIVDWYYQRTVPSYFEQDSIN